MWRSPLLGKIPLALLAELVSGCFERIAIEGAPCPCPSGYICCETRSGCIKETEPCPTTYDTSSHEGCTDDGACPRGELCHAWELDDDSIAGPRQCRKSCRPPYECAGDDECELAPSGGAPLADIHVARLCMPGETNPACAAIDCKSCSEEHVGATYCSGAQVVGCLFALHEKCGLQCRTIPLDDCYSAETCVETDGAARCNDYDADRCVDYDCAACRAKLPGGVNGCVNNGIAACIEAKYAGFACDTICVLAESPCPAGTRCVDHGGPRCETDE